ncbi:MAG: DoxX family protein [Anaerolineaceae bacterium]|jgi:putative oxidoreductase|nr:DoxX family protein [Anaerolineaceae bacterium]
MYIDAGLLVLRIVLGLSLMGHGAQKLFGWFQGGGLPGAQQMMQHMGLRPAWLWALLSGLSEFGGGLLLVLGLLHPLGSLGVMAAMTTAIVKVHWRNGFWNTQRGVEFPLINLAAALALGLSGPGAYSLDAALGVALPEPAALIAGLALVALGILAQGVSQQPAAQPAK